MTQPVRILAIQEPPRGYPWQRRLARLRWMQAVRRGRTWGRVYLIWEDNVVEFPSKEAAEYALTQDDRA